jgi:hypothetical protein
VVVGATLIVEGGVLEEAATTVTDDGVVTVAVGATTTTNEGVVKVGATAGGEGLGCVSISRKGTAVMAANANFSTVDRAM